ncbi:MAG: DNRLRE domain-containing protein, partial [Crocinitomix sp.]|nr:DNRLRE domain-containing protein [Crocinitomix sp.]
MILAKKYMLLGWGLLTGLVLTAQSTTVNFTSTGTMQDAFVGNGGIENTNFGSQDRLNVFYDKSSTIAKVFRSFISYDLSSIPANAIIVDAKLKLVTHTVNNTISHPIYVQRVNQSWSSSTVTWNNQPSVITSDQLSFTHAQTSGTGTHQLNVTAHVQKMVKDPSTNQGWRIRLQSESGASTFGLMYHSSEATSSGNRPVLTVEYVLPLSLTPTVSHCTPGNSDGSFSVAVSGGSTTSLGNIYFYKTVRDTTQIGVATLVNAKTTNNIQYNATTKTITGENLSPGIYLLRVLDTKYSVASNPRLAFNLHILVGREGEITKGILMPHETYQENMTISRDKPSNSSPTDRINTNYYSGSAVTLRASASPNVYEYAALIKYDMDFDYQLDITKAELRMKAFASGFARYANSSNAVNYSIVTSPWTEEDVTWNIRPTIDSTQKIQIATTTYMGYDPVHNWDTISLIPFVEYWSENPTENHGFEIALQNYNASQFAAREYLSAAGNVNFMYFEFSVKPKTVVTFNDTTNFGKILINAPLGPLPYKYLINTEPIGSLAASWAIIDSLDYIDSVDFFTSDISAREYSFDNLPSGKYYVSVFNNVGTKIMDDSAMVTTTLGVYDRTSVQLSSTNVITRSFGATGNASGRLFAELLKNEDYGGVEFIVKTLDDFTIGFNKSSQSKASASSDFEFGLKVTSTGSYQIIENNSLLTSTASISAGAKINLYRDHGDYVLKINGAEVYRGPITSLAASDASVDFMLAAGSIELSSYWGGFKKPGIKVQIDYPECGYFTGKVIVSKSELGTIAFCTMTNNAIGGTNPTATVVGGVYEFNDVPIGTYTLTTGYSVPPLGGYLGYSYVITEQIAVGYLVEWEDLVDSYVLPLNTIQRGPGIVTPGIATANSSNVTYDEYKNWLQFSTYVHSPFLATSAGIENLAFRELGAGTEAIRLISGGLFVPQTISTFTTLELGVASLHPGPVNATFRIEQEDEIFSIFRNGGASIETGASAISGPYEISISQTNGVRYITSVASFCPNYPIPDQFVEPKREIE